MTHALMNVFSVAPYTFIKAILGPTEPYRLWVCRRDQVFIAAFPPWRRLTHRKSGAESVPGSYSRYIDVEKSTIFGVGFSLIRRLYQSSGEEVDDHFVRA